MNGIRPMLGVRYRWGVLLLAAGAVVAVLLAPLEWGGRTSFSGGYYHGDIPGLGAVRLMLTPENQFAYGTLGIEETGEEAWLRMGMIRDGRLHLTVDRRRRGADDPPDASIVGNLESGTGTFSGRWISSEAADGRPFALHRVARRRVVRRDSGFMLGKYGGTKRFEGAVPVFEDVTTFHLQVGRELDAECRAAGLEFASGAIGHLRDALANRSGPIWSWYRSRDYQLIWLAADVVSVLVVQSEYTGGAHPNHTFDTWNFARHGEDARSFGLAALFREDGQWRETLSEICVRELRRQGASEAVNGRLARLTPEEMGHFTMSTSGLQIHFPPYAVGAYAEGSFTVAIPWAELRADLHPEGPVRSAWVSRE